MRKGTKEDILYGKTVVAKAQNLFINSKLPEILESYNTNYWSIDIYFIAAIMDKFKIDYIFQGKELTQTDVKTLKNIIGLLEKVRDGGRDLTEIYEIIRNNNDLHLNSFFFGILEITHSEEYSKSIPNYIPYNKELYDKVIKILNSLEVGDIINPFRGIIRRSEIIANKRKERRHNFREFLFFLKFYLEDDLQFRNNTAGSRSPYKTLDTNDIYFLLILCSPFEEEFFKKIGKYGKDFEDYYVSKKMPGITKLSDICPAFDILYEYYKPFYKKRGKKQQFSMPKVLSNFLGNYLDASQERYYEKIESAIREEYDDFKKDYENNRFYYEQEIEKFHYNYKHKENSYESELPLTDGITQIIREFPAEEADNISEFLNKQIQLLYPNDSNNKKKYLIKDNFKYLELINIPKIQETLKLFKYISPDEIKEIPLKLDFKEEDKLIIYLYIAEYFLPPNLYKRILEFKLKQTSNKNYITL